MSDGPITSPSQLDDDSSTPNTAAGALTPADVGLPDDPVASGSSVIHNADEAPIPVSQSNPLTSFGFRGMTERGKANAGGVFGQADRAVSDFAKQDEQRQQQEREDSKLHTAQASRAVQGEVTATNDYLDRDRELEQRLVAFNEHAAATEQRMNAEAQVARQKYLADYQEQLAGVRALSAQSGNPLSQLDGGTKIGLAGAMFAQGFLATRGIHIDVGGQIDRWVDRSIAEHQQAIQNQRANAEDSLHLYEIARQSSQDDYEARQRYRGFVIAGLQTAIQANANRFQSQIAVAKAQESIAKLQIEADTTQRQIADAHFNRVREMMTTEFDRAYKQGMLGIEEYKAATDRLKANAKLSAPNINISDPEYLRDKQGNEIKDAKGNRIMVNGWRVKPGMPNEITEAVRKEAQSARDNYADYLTKTNRMIDSYREASKIRADAPAYIKAGGWGAVARWDGSGKVAQFLDDKDQWVMSRVYNDSGKQINENEFKIHREQIDRGLEKIFANNSGEKADRIMANLRESGRQTFERHMENSGLQPIEDNDPERVIKSVPVSPGTKTEDTFMLSDHQPPTTSQEAKDEATVVSPDRAKPEVGSGQRDAASPSFVEYLNTVTKTDDPNAWLETNGYRREYAAIDRLAAEAVNPTADAEHTSAAMSALTRLANGDTTAGKRASKDAEDYAKYVLNRVESASTGDPAFGMERTEDQQKNPAVSQFNPTVGYRFRRVQGAPLPVMIPGSDE